MLYDAAGRRVMVGVHPLEDLAPRDVVAAAISRRMAEAPGGVDDHVFLDATGTWAQRFYERFPSITAACREIGIDPARDRIPVAPAAHFACGGVPARLDGTTRDAAGLYAVGEVPCTGVHGANRLASNSLTEGVVAGHRPRARPGVGAAGRGGAGRRRRCHRRRAVARRRPPARDPRARCPATSACCATPASLQAAADVLDAACRQGRRPTATRRSGRGRRRTCSRWRRPSRGGRGARGEPGLPPPHRLPRAPRRVAPAPRPHARRPTARWRFA